MCLIAVKPRNAPLNMTTMAYLEDAFDSNPDGAGLMYRVKGRIHIVKGLMTWQHFESKLPLIADKAAVIHFRWATHGTLNKGNTHPFPLSSREHDLKACNVTTEVGVAHNGIVQGLHDKVLSDTALYVRDYLSQLTMTPEILDLLRFHHDGTSKFAIMTPKTIHLIGNFIKDSGWLWSNASYLPLYAQKYWSTNFEDEVCDYCGVVMDDPHDFSGGQICTNCWDAVDQEGYAG